MNDVDRKYPPVIEWEISSLPQGTVGSQAWYAHQYPIIKKFFQKKMDGWSFGDFLLEQDCKSVVLYAITDFSDLVARDLIHSAPEIELKYFACNDAERHTHGYMGLGVYGVDKLAEDYLAGKVDKIVVCNIFHTNEIFNDLLAAGILLRDLISICSVVLV